MFGIGSPVSFFCLFFLLIKSAPSLVVVSAQIGYIMRGVFAMFGVVSLIIVLACIYAMIFHFRVLKRRGEMDEKFVAVDDVLRLQLEIIYDAAENLPEPTQIHELREMCEIFSEYESRKLFKSIPKLRKSVPTQDALSEAVSETENAVAALNEEIERYNAYASKFPANVMVAILGLSKEKKF